MLGFAGIGQTIEAAAEFDDSAALTQGVERVGVHSECDQVASTERAALIAESLECGVEVAGFHVGNNSTIYNKWYC